LTHLTPLLFVYHACMKDQKDTEYHIEEKVQ